MSQRTVEETLALHALLGTPGLDVIVSKLRQMISTTSDPVPLNEANWDYKVADQQGYLKGLNDYLTWLEGRLTATVDPDGKTVRRKPRA